MSPFVILGIIIVGSFWYLDRSLAKWKKEQDEKLEDIKSALDDLVTDFYKIIN